MIIRKIGFPAGLFATIAMAAFMSLSPSADSYGQTEAPPEGEVGSPLPRSGNITVNFKDVDILTVLNYLSEVSGVDIIPSPGIEANVTMRLRDKPWEVALDIVARNYGYTYSREEDIIRVMPRSMLQAEEPVTEVIFLNHIIQEIELAKEGATGGEGGVMVEKKQQGIDQVMSAVRTILDPGRGEKATFVSSANAIVITAIPAKVTSIKEMLSKVDRRPPQILLEAKIIEIILDDDEQLGIDWNLIISAAGARRPVTFPFTNTGLLSFLPGEQAGFFPSYTADQSIARFPSVYDAAQGMDVRAASVANSIFSYGTLDCSQLAATLRMIDDTRDTNILSTPRITTLNNQRATIKVVQKVMLQKTQEAIQTANVITVEFEKDADAREIGVKLTVIPHVNETGDIVVNLIPEVSSDLAFEEREVSGAQNTVAMTYNTREANTRVRVQDGETIFIGGLIRDQVVKRVDKFPLLGDLLGDIPYLGKAFKYEAENVDKTEIVFFVTVHLVKDGMDSIDKSNTMDMFGAYHTDYYGYKQWEQEKKEAEPEEKGSGPEKEGHAVKTEKPGEKEKGPEAAERPRLKKGGTSIKKARSLISLPPDRENKKEENEPWLDFR